MHVFLGVASLVVAVGLVSFGVTKQPEQEPVRFVQTAETFHVAPSRTEQAQEPSITAKMMKTDYFAEPTTATAGWADDDIMGLVVASSSGNKTTPIVTPVPCPPTAECVNPWADQKPTHFQMLDSLKTNPTLSIPSVGGQLGQGIMQGY